MSEEATDYQSSLENSQLMEMFPEAKLTMRDRLPMNFILTNALITIQKSILNIKYSAEEIREAIQGFVAMIPDQLKDEQFNADMENARQRIIVDSRPNFCGTPANDKYLIRKGINPTREIETFNTFQVLHACFNLLMRKNMLLKIQPKEIFTGKKGAGEEEEFEPDPNTEE